VLEGALAPRMGNHEVRELWKAVSTFTDPVDPAFVRDFQQSSIARPVPSDFFEGVVADSLKVPARVWKGALEPLTTMEFLPQLERIAVPTLLVWGDRDAFVARAEQDVLQKSIAGSRLVTYAGAGHSPHWEEPERFAADLMAFIRSVDAP
jgi:pimeloyl-ACP methyl ester carboxylesterase